MKKIILILAFVYAANATAQTQYEKGMTKAFELWENQKNTEAAQLFERIATAEKDNWIPPYYAATLSILSAFEIKDEATLTAKLNKAKVFLDAASKISENNPEIMMSYALLNTAYIAFDGQKYGMTLSGKNSMLYAKALEIAPKNPRVILGNAEWNMGAAKFFGKSTQPYCDAIKKAIELGKTEKVEKEFYPKFQVKRAEQVLKQCQG